MGRKPMGDLGRSLGRDSEAAVVSLDERGAVAGKHGGGPVTTHRPRYAHSANGRRPRHF